MRRRDGGLSAALRAGRRPAARPGHLDDVRDRRRSWCAGPAILTASVYRTDVRDDISFIQSARMRCSRASSPTSATPGARASSSASRCCRARPCRSTLTTPSPAPRTATRPRSSACAPRTTSPGRHWRGQRRGGGRPAAARAGHQVKAGGLVQLPAGVALGLDLRYTGRQWLRGDEANETEPLGGYFTRLGARRPYPGRLGAVRRGDQRLRLACGRCSAPSTRTAAPASSSVSSRRWAPARSRSSSGEVLAADGGPKRPA